MAGIQAELDPAVARPGEDILHRPGGPVVISSISPLDRRLGSMLDGKSMRERVHALVDALFDEDDRVEQGQFFQITLNL